MPLLFTPFTYFQVVNNIKMGLKDTKMCILKQSFGINGQDSIRKDGKQSLNFYGLILTYFENVNFKIDAFKFVP